MTEPREVVWTDERIISEAEAVVAHWKQHETPQRLYRRDIRTCLTQIRDDLRATIDAQAQEIASLKAELAEVTGQMLAWHYDIKHEWGFPFSEEVWANNPRRQRYKELTGTDWVAPDEINDEEGEDNE